MQIASLPLVADPGCPIRDGAALAAPPALMARPALDVAPAALTQLRDAMGRLASAHAHAAHGSNAGIAGHR